MPEITEDQLLKYDNAFAFVEQKEKIDGILQLIREQGSHRTFALEPQRKVMILKEIYIPADATTHLPAGGPLTYFEETPYPKKGFFDAHTVSKVDDLKKVIKSFLQGFSGARGKIFLFLLVLFFRKSIEHTFWKLMWNLSDTLEFYALRAECYCPAVQEVYKAIDDKSLRRVACVMLEFDDAYRFRFQDAFGELDKVKLAASPFSEIDRVVELLELREVDPRLQETWRMMRKLFFFLLFFSKPRKLILDFFFRLDPERIKMDESDRYFARMKGEYTWDHN